MKKIGIIWVYKEDKNGSFTRLYDDFVEALESDGNMVIHIIPSNTKNIEYFIQEMDGFILPGGDDVSPCVYGKEKVGSRESYVHNDRRILWFLEKILESKKPVLWVCRGMQLINIYFWGTLQQDIAESGLHDQVSQAREYIHGIILEKKSLLDKVFAWEEAMVNSIHHQAIDELGQWLEVLALSHDGYIEAIWHADFPQVLGVQWHPELLEKQRVLFEEFF